MDGTARDSEEKVLDIAPISKWKRLLLSLSDIVICFILGIVLMNLAVYPLAKLATGYSSDSVTLNQAEEDRDEVLYGNGLLFYTEGSKGDFDTNLETTFTYYLAYYVPNAFVSVSGGEVLMTYYVDIRNDQESYLSLYHKLDDGYGFFEYGDDGYPVLKSAYQEEFVDSFDPKSEMGTTAKDHYDTFKDKLFLKGYYSVIDDISTNDLTYPDGKGGTLSYKDSQAVVLSISGKRNTVIIASSYISFFLSLLVCYLLIPLINKRRKTLSMMFLRYERISVLDFRIMKKRDALILLAYQLGLNIVGVLFIPLPNVSFSYLFNLDSLFPVSLVSLAFIFGSMIFMFINQFGRTLVDFLTKSVVVTDEDLDNIYRAKGYDV